MYARARWMATAVLWASGLATGHAQPVAIQGGLAIDGHGHATVEPTIVVQDGRILAIGPDIETPPDTHVVDLSGYTLLPGLIDAHVHITWHFDGRDERRSLTALHGAANARILLEHGFTTVRSLGDPDYADVDLRNAIAAGLVPGPRLLVSGEGLTDAILPGAEGDAAATGTPAAGEAAIRQVVRERIERGVDWVKIFATRSSRLGGTVVYSPEQLTWTVDEARRGGVPVSAHAHSSEGVRRAVIAGARTIEHAALADDEALDLMLARGTYYMPNLYLPEYYLANAGRFGFSQEALDWTRKLIPARTTVFRKAVEKGVRIVFSTDANAGWIASGTTALEFERRIAAGQPPGDAIVSATSRAAEALQLGDEIGDLAPGLTADIIAVEGNPLEDIAALGRVVFVMRGGQIYKQPRQDAEDAAR